MRLTEFLSRSLTKAPSPLLLPTPCPQCCHYSDSIKGRLHGRKIGYGLVKKGARTSHFCPCKQSVPYLGDGYRPVFFSGFGAIDAYGPQTRKNTGPYSFLNSYVSLRNNFANDMRSKKSRVALGTRTCSRIHESSQTIHCQRMFHMQARTKHYFVVVAKLIFQPYSESKNIKKITMDFNFLFR